MEKSITTALLIIASIVAAMALFNAVMPAMGKSSGALVTANAAAADRIRTDIEIIHATGDSGTNKITVWVKNIGTQVISSVTASDLLITDSSSVKRLPYQSGCSSECWDYQIEDSATAWVQAVTVKFTLSTAVSAGAYSVSVSVANAVNATKDFSV